MSKQQKKIAGLTKTIRIDLELFEHLTMFAEPFVDNPNSVMRMIVGLDKKSEWFEAVEKSSEIL